LDELILTYSPAAFVKDCSTPSTRKAKRAAVYAAETLARAMADKDLKK